MDSAKKKILIADDNEFFIKQQVAFLGPDRFAISTASSGAEVVEKACTELPDLILLDHILGDRLGPDLCRQLKANPATSGIPIILVSSAEQESSRIETAKAGCDGIIFKPIRRNQLLTLVEEFLDIAVRHWKRAAVSIPCTVQRGDTAREGRIHSLGGGGIFLGGDHDNLPGDSCRLEFSIPGTQTPVRVREALVVWLGRINSTGPEGAGLKFLSILEEDREAINRYVEEMVGE